MHLVTRFGTSRAHRPAPKVRPSVEDEELLSVVEKTGVRLVSFDVFDTVIARRMVDPSVLFLLVGQDLVRRGIFTSSAETFMRLRISAEARARKSFPGREATLKEIYAEMVFSLDLENKVDELIAAELQAERESLCPVPQMQLTTERIRRRLGRIIYTSDMYLPAEFVEERLRAFDLLKDGDKLYISSLGGGLKGEGGLFKTVLEQERLKPEQLLHCGNSHEVDVKAAQRSGIHAYYYNVANPNPSEVILNEYALRTEGITSLLAGVSRKVRLEGLAWDDDTRVVWDTAASVTAPLVFTYAQWIIDRAVEKGVRTLVFLARDAWLPYLTVNALLADRPELGLRTCYVYGSRATYLPLAIERLGEEEWNQLLDHRQKRLPSINAVMAALLADKELMAAHLSAVEFDDADWDRPLTEPELTRLKRHVLEHEPFNQALLERLRSAADLMKRYLTSDEFGLEGSIALVDTGWTTKSHAPVYRLLENEGCEVRLFFLGVNSTKTAVPLDRVETFLYNRATGKGVRPQPFEFARAVETLLMARHGRTQCFRETEGKVEPVLAAPENRVFLDRFFAAYEQAVMRFVEEARPLAPQLRHAHDYRGAIGRMMKRFWSGPTVDEARIWSTLRWEADRMGNRKYMLASPYSFADAWAAFREKRFPRRYTWWEAAVQLTPPSPLLLIKAAILARRILVRGTRAAGSCFQKAIPAPRRNAASPATVRLASASPGGTPGMCVRLEDFLPPLEGKTGWPWTEGSELQADATRGNQSWPKISIVIPSFNQGRYLEECIRSVLLQGYPNLEVFVIDGGSTDESVSILRKYERWLTGWVSERDSGQSEAINKGFARCTGEIFNWLCSDDLLARDALFAVATAFEEEQECDVVAGSCYCHYENEPQKSSVRPSSVETIQRAPYAFGVWQPSCFFRPSLIDRSELVRNDLHYCMDRELWCYLCRQGARWKQLDRVLSVNRFTGENKSVKGRHKVIEEIDVMYREYVKEPVPLTYWLRSIWLPLVRLHHHHPWLLVRAGSRALSTCVSAMLRTLYPQDRVKTLRAEFLVYEMW